MADIGGMADYAALDAHSRNCADCRRQREEGGSRRPSTAHGKQSLQEQRRSCHGELPSRPLVRRSNSTLSCSSEGNPRREEGDPSSYLTPTQRKNQEVKRLRTELSRTSQRLEERDKEVTRLRRELMALREGGVPDNDSGNCEEEDGEGERVEFEFVESALREEEETRQRLEEENRELLLELHRVKEQLEESEKKREEEVKKVRREQEEGELEGRRERSQREAELVRELGESSLRCARQQEAIEKATKKEEEAKKEREEKEVEMQRLREKIVKLQVDHNSGSDSVDIEAMRETEDELQRLQQEVSKHQEEKRSLEIKARKQEETKIQEVNKLEEEVKRLKEEVVKLKAGRDEKEEKEKKGKHADRDDVRGDQRTERTKDFLANHSKSTSTEETTYLSGSRKNETKENSSQTASIDVKQYNPCQDKTLEEVDGRRSSKGSESKLEDVSLADEVKTDERVHFTFQFLRRSIYYFLTDKENSGYHLRCMERLLEFTEGERAAIETSRGAKTPSVRKQRY